MTLVLTELSTAGVAMAADSAITKLSPEGKVTEVDQQGWKKLLRVPSITAAVSYWGSVGSLTEVEFDRWLKRVIDREDYQDLPSFAQRLADAMNEAAGGEPLGAGKDLGVHVAGYHHWQDDVTRPFFYHVHNGHGHFVVSDTRNGNRLLAVHPQWISEPRRLFQKHQDFPRASMSVAENVAMLENGYATRNGAFFIYAVLWQHMEQALGYINAIPDVSVPRDPTDLNSRKGFLHTVLEMMVRIYRCSNQSPIVGGRVTSLAIGPEGFLP
jgi:hypothetical protein